MACLKIGQEIIHKCQIDFAETVAVLVRSERARINQKIEGKFF
jgi:hypothetical protein